MKCIICGKKAMGKFSPDLDVNGIGFCKKDKQQVMIGYIVLLQGDEELAKELLKVKTKDKVK